jgi:hypothetical protein
LHLELSLARLLPIVWLISLAAYILAGAPLVPFHGDEATQIYMSRDYVYQFLERDLSKLRYSPTPASPQEQDLRLLNGTVNKYLIGLAWHLAGFQPGDLNQQWDWGAGWDYNQANGHAPSPALLLIARWPSALLLAAGVFVMFGLAQAVAGRFTPYLASLYYALNPPLLLNGRRAMMEGTFTCFSLLTVLAGIWWLNRPDWKRGLLLGVAGGLALASKHTALFTVLPIFAVCGLYGVWKLVLGARHGLLHPHPPATSPLRREGESESPSLRSGEGLGRGAWSRQGAYGMRYGLPAQNRLSMIGNLVLPFAVMAVTFLALNPAWWDNPLTRPALVLKMRNNLLTIQTRFFGQYSGANEQLAGFGRQALVALPQYYEAPGWGDYLKEQIAGYEASPWHGVSIGGSVIGAVVLFLAMIVGMWALIRCITVPVRVLVGAWALVMLLTTLLLTPLEWGRYYLPVYPAVGLLAALGINWMISRIWKRRSSAYENPLCPTG